MCCTGGRERHSFRQHHQTSGGAVGMARLEEAAVEFAENPEPRCACLLLLDTSSSMQGEPIQALNAGLRTLKEALSKDPVASRRVEVAVVTFDNRVAVAQDFVTIDKFERSEERRVGKEVKSE